VTCWPSRHYLEQAIELGVGSREALEAKAEFVGYVRADPLSQSSREATRREWGIATNRPVVLFVPDGYRLGRGRAYVTDWYRHVWCVESRPERLARAVVARRSLQAVWEAISEPDSYGQVVRAVRRFCDRNDVQLVLMPRRKKEWVAGQPLTREERQAADHTIKEDEYYPQTFPKAAQMADLVVCGYCSGCVLDTIAAGVPYVTIAHPARARLPKDFRYDERFARDVGHWPGATWLIGMKQFARSFGAQSLEHYRLDPEVLARVRERFLGSVDGLCAQRVLASIRRRLESRERAGMPLVQRSWR